MELIDEDSGRHHHCQVTPAEAGLYVTWLVRGLKAEGRQRLLARPGWTRRRSSGVEITDRPESGRVDVRISGAHFTSYHYGKQWVRPFLHPVTGPEGVQVTRNWPIKKRVKGEHRDHPHHKSIWVAHGECDRVDNWSEEPGHGWQKHQEFLALASGPVFGRIHARNNWCYPSGRKQFEELRDMRFYNLPGGLRLLDMEITLRMTPGAVTFRDTKEGGLLSVRVASAMDVRNGGRIENAYGAINEEETWGKPAPWCDYSGTVAGRPVGIAAMDHPNNPRYPTGWHVRNYGLMTANCFAWTYYFPQSKVRGDMAFAKGQETTWRYRLYIHKGDARQGKVAQRFLDYAAPPKVTVA